MANLIGQTLKQRYEVIESLGRGGMAEVFKVWDNQRAVHLAMKVLRQDIAQDPIFLRRFQREAKALSSLQHPNIVRFFGLDREDLISFLLMEYVEGVSLQAEILRNNDAPLQNNRVMEILQPICSALHYAHQQGITHCDLKPGNILIDYNGRVLLTDFGIARTLDAATATMAGIGTPAYMAPELVRGEEATPQTDVYALGVVLYEMLTGGERPFTGEGASITGTTAEKVRWEQVKAAPTPPSHYNPKILPDWERVVLRCLEKGKHQRFAGPMDVFKAIQPGGNHPAHDFSEVQKGSGFFKDGIYHEPASRPPASPKSQPSPEAKKPKFALASDPPVTPKKAGQLGLWAGLIALLVTGVIALFAIQPKNQVGNSGNVSTVANLSAAAKAEIADAERANLLYQAGQTPIAREITLMDRSYPLLFLNGWGAKDSIFLAENLPFLKWDFKLNGEQVPENKVGAYSFPEATYQYILVDNWQPGDHSASVNLEILETIDDGWDNFEPQVFKNPYQIKVSSGSGQLNYLNWPVVFQDNFSTNDGLWWTGKLDKSWYDYTGETSIRDGKYIFQVDEFSFEGVMDYNFAPILTVGDFYITAVIGSGQEDLTGCYELTVLDLYSFDICEDQSYFISYELREEDFEELVGLTYTKDINPSGANVISILKIGDSLTLFINGVEQSTVNTHGENFGGVGLGIFVQSQPATFTFDDISIHMP
jgi:serine/threonine-protein kinase